MPTTNDKNMKAEKGVLANKRERLLNKIVKSGAIEKKKKNVSECGFPNDVIVFALASSPSS